MSRAHALRGVFFSPCLFSSKGGVRTTLRVRDLRSLGRGGALVGPLRILSRSSFQKRTDLSLRPTSRNVWPHTSQRRGALSLSLSLSLSQDGANLSGGGCVARSTERFYGCFGRFVRIAGDQIVPSLRRPYASRNTRQTRVRYYSKICTRVHASRARMPSGKETTMTTSY